MGKKRLMIGFLMVVIAASLGFWLYKRHQPEESFISRASAAKVVALLMHSPSECLLAKAEPMPDVSDTMSLAPYIHTVVSDGVMLCDGEFFYPMKLLTYENLRLIANKLDIDISGPGFDLSKKKSEDFVTLSCWNRFVSLCSEEKKVFTKKQAVLLGTSSTIAELAPWICRTSEGDYSFTGLTLDGFIGETIEFYVRENEIAQVLTVSESNPKKQTDKEKSLESAVAKEHEQAKETVDGGTINETNTDANEKTQDKTQDKTVRVVLNTDGFSGLVHTNVTVSSDQPFVISAGGSEESYQGGAAVSFEPEDMRLSDGKAVIRPESSDGRIQVLSLNRAQGHPMYRGKIEIIKKDGGLVIVNELPLEAYLYGVLPSEMPVSGGLEALKVQAVCARSFVTAALNESSKFQSYEADVDDSTSSQVYQNIGEDSLASQAVDETKGQVLYAGDSIVKTYFFSTSCGVTSDVGDVWGGEGQSYLIPVFQTVDTSHADLSVEENFRDFIDLKDGKYYYENQFSWFRWSVLIDSPSIIHGFASVSENYKNGEIIGNVREITVTERGKSGIAKTLTIISDGAKASVSGEYSIRKALSVAGKTILCHDGTTVENQTMMPSGYFYVDSLSDGTFEICGGGFGHGVGMSQNGAVAMCQLGMSYDQVLTHFYAGTEIKEQ